MDADNQQRRDLDAPVVRGWRWRIVGGNELGVRDTIRVGVAMREMLIEAARWSRGSHALPLCLHGPTPDHSHARYLPEDEDGDGFIDHLTVYSSGGLDGVAIRLLAMSQRVFVPGLGAHDLEPIWMGARPSGAAFKQSAAWVSRTPWVAPWFKDPTGRQLRKEIPLAGIHQALLPTEGKADQGVVELRRITGQEFVLTRSEDPPPSPPRAGMLRLEFSAPIPGPVALGYGSHFGLGQFVPA